MYFTPLKLSDLIPVRILLAVLSVTSVASTALAGDYHRWALDYYNENNACSVAEIESLKRTVELVSVRLTVEQNSAAGLAALPEPDRDAWLALHCPHAAHSAWRESQEPFDIIIEVKLTDDAISRLSCADFNATQNTLRAQKKSSVLERLQQLLGAAR